MIRLTPNPKGIERVRTIIQGLSITERDMGGPILVRFGQLHREQVKAAFTSQGASTPGYKWFPLNPSYAARKKKVAPGKKILVLSGDMRRRLTTRSSPYYIQVYRGGGKFSFGARSSVAAAHVAGNPDLAYPRRIGPTKAGAIFGGKAPRLPVRDMIAKTAAQFAAFPARLKKWYVEERVPQVLRGIGRLR